MCRLDYCGIIILIVTSFPPWLYFAFYCHWAIKCAYISLVTSLGVASVAVVLQDRFRTPAYLHLRAGENSNNDNNSTNGEIINGEDFEQFLTQFSSLFIHK